MFINSILFVVMAVVISIVYPNISLAAQGFSGVPCIGAMDTSLPPNLRYDYKWLDEVRAQEPLLIGKKLVFNLTDSTVFVRRANAERSIITSPTIQGTLVEFSDIGTAFFYKILTPANELLVVTMASPRSYAEIKSLRRLSN